MKPIQTFHTDKRYVVKGDTTGASTLYVEERIDDNNDSKVFSSVWEPSEEERRAIADGANIELHCWGAQIPVAIGVNDDPKVSQ